jgi:tetratricopeptide (TPR) repeat protein
MLTARTVFSALSLLLLLPAGAWAETASGRYESQCVPSAAQDTAFGCPSGAEAVAGRGGKVPASRLATGGREETPIKREAQKGPGVSDTLVQEARSGFKVQRQKRVEAIIRQEIDLTKRLIGNTRADNPEMAPRRLRLAQNYEDLLEAARASVRELDEPIFQAREAGNERQQKQLIKQQNDREVQVTEFRDAAIKQYALIARDFPDYQSRDEVLFRLAFMIDEQAADDRLRNERDERPVPSDNEKTLREQARRVYRELIKSFPNSQYIPNAYLSFAEYYFQEGDMENALQFYERVAQYEDSEVFGYALYKMAWCYINLQDDRQAVSQFVRVIEHAMSNPDARIARPLARQARREIIPPFSRVFPPAQAWDFFQRIGGDEALDLMEALADHYYNQGQWAQATAAYHSLLAENEGSHRLCFYQTRVAECSRRGVPKADQVIEIRRTVDLMNTYLQATHPEENVTECRQVVAQMVLEMATNWHQEAVGSDRSPGTNDVATMELASQLYGLALETFPNLDEIQFEGWPEDNRPTRYRVSYWAAELLWKRNQWSECGPAFDRVVEIDPEGEYLRDAAYAAVLCYNNLYEAQNEDDTQVRGKAAPRPGKAGRKRQVDEEEQERQELERLQRRELNAVEQGMLDAYTRFVCYVTESDELVTIKYRRARIFYVANQWEEAAALFRDIAYNHSDADLAPYAANQYLDCLNAISRLNQDRRIGCRDEMADTVDDFLANENLIRDEEFRAQITQLQCGILWKRAEAYGEAHQFREAGDLYVRIYADYGDECQNIGEGHDICEVLYNAAIMFESDYRIGSAIQIRTRLFRECGDESEYAKSHNGASEWAKRAIYQIGGNYHAIAAYTKAAEYYEEFAGRYSGEEDAPEALRYATVFRIGLGHDAQAIKNASLFEKNYGRRNQFKSQTATVVFSIGTIYMRNKAWVASEKHYDGFLKRYGGAASSDEKIQAHTSLGFSLWQQGGKARERADDEFRKAVTLADIGRTEGENLAARLARYRKMISGGEGSADQEASEANLQVVRMVNSVAKARFYLGEAGYEDFQAISFPAFRADKTLPRDVRSWWTEKQGRDKARLWEEDLRFLTAEERRTAISSVQFQFWVEKAFASWRDRKDQAREVASKLYMSTVDEDVPEWEIASAARMGDMLQSFMQALYDAPIDPSIANDQELVDIYRDALDQAAEPYRDGAIKAFEHCLGVATENRWFNEWSRSCEAQLNKLDPRTYPVSDELRAEPAYNLSPLARPVIIKRLKTVAEQEAENARAAAEQQE